MSRHQTRVESTRCPATCAKYSRAVDNLLTPPADSMKSLVVPSRCERREHAGTRLVTLGSRKATFPDSDNERSLQIYRAFYTMMLYFRSCNFVQKIESQTVFGESGLLHQPMPELDPVGFSQNAFKYRLLDALTVVLAGLRHPAEPSPSRSCFRGHVVSHNYEHSSTSTHTAHKTQSLPESPEREFSPGDAAVGPHA